MFLPDELRVEAIPENVRKIGDFVREVGRRLRLTEDALFDIDLAVEEASTNIVRHAYGPDRAGDILVRVEAVDDVVWVTLTDWGVPLNADHLVPFDVDAPAEARIQGGMGLHLIRGLMDDVVRKTSSASGGPNVLTLSKRVEHRPAP
jgi:serine/threonine-protein kinase RsbW